MSESVALVDRAVRWIVGTIVPGGVVLFACATGSDTVRGWFAGAQAGPTFVGFAFVLLGALALGIVVMALRFCLFEVLRVPFRGRPIVPAPDPIDERNRAAHAATYEDLRRSHYDFYLAGSGLAVAIPLGTVIWLVLAPPGVPKRQAIGIAVLGLVAAWALGVGAVHAIARYRRKRALLVGRPADAA